MQQNDCECYHLIRWLVVTLLAYIPLPSRANGSIESSHTTRSTMSPLAISQKSKSTTNAAVRFKNSVRIRNISSHRDFSREEKSKCWYTPQDFSLMKQETLMLIKSEITEWNELRAFGLEAPQNCKLRRANIIRAKVTVLTEQEKLWRDGVTSRGDIISMRCKSVSQTSRDDARQRAAIAAATVRAFELQSSENPRSNKHDSLPRRSRRVISVSISQNLPTGWQRI
jgi:hypothetical protein